MQSEAPLYLALIILAFCTLVLCNAVSLCFPLVIKDDSEELEELCERNLDEAYFASKCVMESDYTLVYKPRQLANARDLGPFSSYNCSDDHAGGYRSLYDKCNNLRLMNEIGQITYIPASLAYITLVAIFRECVRLIDDQLSWHNWLNRAFNLSLIHI